MGIILLENEKMELPLRATGDEHIPKGKGVRIGGTTTNKKMNITLPRRGKRTSWS
jgi:hypothetical protein